SGGRGCGGCEELTLVASRNCGSPSSPLHRDRAEAWIIGMVQALRLPIFQPIDLKTGPRPVFIGTAGPIWPTTGPHARHLWRMNQVAVPLRKTPARGYCGQVCLSENQVGWGLEVHPPHAAARRHRRLAD